MIEEETRRLISISILKTQEVEAAHSILVSNRNFANFQIFKDAVDGSAEAIRNLMVFYRKNSIKEEPFNAAKSLSANY